MHPSLPESLYREFRIGIVLVPGEYPHLGTRKGVEHASVREGIEVSHEEVGGQPILSAQEETGVSGHHEDPIRILRPRQERCDELLFRSEPSRTDDPHVHGSM